MDDSSGLEEKPAPQRDIWAGQDRATNRWIAWNVAAIILVSVIALIVLWQGLDFFDLAFLALECVVPYLFIALFAALAGKVWISIMRKRYWQSAVVLVASILLAVSLVGGFIYLVESDKSETYAYTYKVVLAPEDNGTYEVIIPMMSHTRLSDYHVVGDCDVFELNETIYGLGLRVVARGEVNLVSNGTVTGMPWLTMANGPWNMVYAGVASVDMIFHAQVDLGDDGWLSDKIEWVDNGQLDAGWNECIFQI